MPVSGHFLSGARGALAAVLWEPPPGTAARAALLGLPPFGDEMNKSRRTMALQARALAARGIAVTLLDPYGTGDSAGEHAEATWPLWRDDARTGATWLRERLGVPTGLWGVRLSALLAAQTARATDAPLLLLWQPVAAGRSFFNQFLRTASAQAVTSGAAEDRKALRARLAQGVPVEIGGYALTRALVDPAEALELAALPPACPVVWRDVGETTAACAGALQAWRAADAHVDHACVSGPPFWSTLEIEEAPELVAATTRALADRFAP